MKYRHLATAFAVSTVLGLVACGGDSEEKLLESAKSFVQQQDHKAAVIQLKSVLQKNPKSGEARFLLGRELRETGDPSGALVELRKAQELGVADEQLFPELARVMLLAGEQTKVAAQFANTELKEPKANADLAVSVATSFAAQGDKVKALEYSNRALQSQPAYAPAVVLQAQLKMADGDVDGALFLLDDVLAKEAGHQRAGALKGDLLWQAKQDRPAAVAAYRKVLAEHPKAVGARTALIGVLYEMNQPEDAAKELAELKKVAPNHPDTVFLDARSAYVAKDYTAARESVGKVLKALPDNVPALELAGATEFRLKSDVQAEAFLGRALKLAPGRLLPRHLLAQVYMRTGQASRAVEVLQPVVDSPKADGVSLALAGEAYLQLGDAKRSDEAFQRAAKVAPADTRVRTSVAIAQLAKGSAGNALTELESIAVGDKSTRPDLAVISGRLRQKDLPGALTAVEALRKKLPDNPLPDLLKGRILVIKGDNAGAEAAFNASLAKEANYFPAIASLAGLDVTAGKPEKAKERFDALIKADPRNHRAYLAQAELVGRSKGPASEITRLLTEAGKAAPAEVGPRLLLVNHLLRQGDAKAAQAAAQDAAAAITGNADVVDALGRAQLAAGDGQQAVSTFKKAAAMQPRNPQYQLRLADAYAALKDNEGVRGSLRRAIELDPELLVAYRGLASLALSEKRPDEALALARELQKKAPKSPSGFNIEGDIEASRKNWPAAVAAQRNALQRSKGTETVVALHNALLGAGQRAEADKLAADWSREQPKDPSFNYYLGDLALSRNELPAAEARYRAVLDAQPSNALAMNNLAWLMVKQGKPGAVAMAEKANAQLPDRAPLLDTLATALAAENQLPKAIEVQKKALQRAPQDPGLRLNLARIYLKAGDKAQARGELQELAKLGDKFGAQAEVATLMKSAQ